MLALHQKANPELTRAKEIKAFHFMGPFHQKPSTSTCTLGLCAGNGPGSPSPTEETFLQKNFLCLQKPSTMSCRPESEATMPGTPKSPVEPQLPKQNAWCIPSPTSYLAEVGWWIILEIFAGHGAALGQFRAAPSKLLERFCFHKLLHTAEDSRQPRGASQDIAGSQQRWVTENTKLILGRITREFRGK